MAEKYRDDVVITLPPPVPAPAGRVEREEEAARQDAWDACRLAAARGDYTAADRWFQVATRQPATAMQSEGQAHANA